MLYVSLHTLRPASGPPSTLRTQPNRPFSALDVYRSSPESGDMWCTSRKLKGAICSRVEGLGTDWPASADQRPNPGGSNAIIGQQVTSPWRERERGRERERKVDLARLGSKKVVHPSVAAQLEEGYESRGAFPECGLRIALRPLVMAMRISLR